MRNNGVLYLDDFLSENKENVNNSESLDHGSFKEIHEIEEYILRKQAMDMCLAPEMIYKDENFPIIPEQYPRRNSEKELEKEKREKRRARKSEGYKPKNVRGKGVLREGMCEICNEWFKLKTSSYWYHMNFKHGISSNGLTYPDPIIIYKEGKAISVCTICKKNVNLGVNKKTMCYNWYKHFQKEHINIYE